MFRFKRFSVENERACLKVGTDAVLLGAAMDLDKVSFEGLKALDIGTGTGVIALMAAQRLEEAGLNDYFIDAIDIDAPSAEEARDNFFASPWKDHLLSVHSSLQDFEKEAGQYGPIFSNPPYYDCSLRNPEARQASARHTDSLSYREICAFAKDHLLPEGRMCIILPSEQRLALNRLASSFGLYPQRIVDIFTSAKKPSRRIIAEFAKEKAEVLADDILIGSEAHRFLMEKFLLSI